MKTLSAVASFALGVIGLAASCGGDDAATSGSSTGGSTSMSSSASGGMGGEGAGGAEPVEPTMLFEPVGLMPEQVAIVVNDQDPVSLAIGAYYAAARGIPAANLVSLSFPTDAVLPPADFADAKSALDAALDPSIQALALTWTTPYRVGCMSVTSAFALGFDMAYCNTTGGACGETAPVGYFDSDSTLPFDDHGVRIAMTIAAETVADGEALIDRGVASDGTFPGGDGYFLRTTDAARSVRWQAFTSTVADWHDPMRLNLSYLDNSDGSGSNLVEDTADILFYFTGLANVGGIDSNQYLPGAIADHLTSFGGRMPTAGGQMSVLRWLEAGATGSYGTTVEPCNYTTKFPNTEVLLPHYFRGETLVEAYWKSVAWPGEGVFVGEPLARPWGSVWALADGELSFSTTSMVPGVPYEVAAGPSAEGPWAPALGPLTVTEHGLHDFVVPDASEPYYLFRRVP